MATSLSGPRAFGSALREEWLLEPGCAYLNHGAFGATPRRVLAAREALTAQLERQPARFMMTELAPLLEAQRTRLARFLGASAEELVFVDNATTAVSAVLGSLALAPGDEIVCTSHGYGAVQKALLHFCQRSGARIVEVPLPFPLPDTAAAADNLIAGAIAKALGERTRLCIVDQLTSPTAVLLPLARVSASCLSRGVPLFVDGAHGPGQLDLELGTLGADYYTGNAHKWLFAPKGCGLLFVRKERQANLHPPVISHGYGRGLAEEFHWLGTRDPSSWLAIGAALDFTEELGPSAVRAHNVKLCADAVSLLGDRLGLVAGAPAPLRAAMATLPLPDGIIETGLCAERLFDATLALNRRLRDEHAIEVPIVPFGGRAWFRVSAQVYNSVDEYDRLASALAALRG